MFENRRLIRDTAKVPIPAISRIPTTLKLVTNKEFHSGLGKLTQRHASAKFVSWIEVGNAIGFINACVGVFTASVTTV